jgi:TfoX/Sxy family transcriptional regulator of competence genes
MATFPHLNELVEDATRGLPGIARKRMFGCDAYFVRDTIFAMIWKDGRIGLKLREPAAYAELMALEGSEPWVPGAAKMSSWVLVPEEFHDDLEALTPWARRAYQQCRAEPAASTTRKVAKATKTAAKATAAKATPAKASRRSARSR